MWRFIPDDGVEGSRAAATDAFLARAYARGGTMPDPTLRVFTYRPMTLLLGRFQSAAAQFRLDECRLRGISVSRRITGGGALLMGQRQIAVSFTTCWDHPSTPARPNDLFTVYGGAICRALRHFGVECHLRPRHDLMVGSAKVGLADARVDAAGAVLFHAYILLDFDPHQAANILRLPPDISRDRAASLLSQRLTSLTHEKSQPVEPATVRDFIRVAFEAGFGIEFQQFPITPLENDGISQLERETYATEQWLHERSPNARMTGFAQRLTPGGLLIAFASRSADEMGPVILAGDFFGDSAALDRFQAALRGSPADLDSIRRAADQFIGSAALEGVDAMDIVEVVSEALDSAAGAGSPADLACGLPQSFA